MTRAGSPLFPERSAFDRFGYVLRTCRQERGLSHVAMGRYLNISGDMLGKIERAERHPTESLAERAERLLKADGRIIDAWHEYDKEKKRLRQERVDSIAAGLGLDDTPGSSGTGSQPQLAPDSAGPAQESVPAVMGAEIPASPDSAAGAAYWGDHFAFPCQASDGRTVWMSVPRRSLLLGGAGTVGAAAIGGSVPSNRIMEKLSTGDLSAEMSPFEHWQSAWKLLADSDNLLGPKYTIPAALDQLKAMLGYAVRARGSDRVKLFQMQVEFANLLSWMHQDLHAYSEAQYWLDRALEWSHVVGDSEATAVVLSLKGELACSMGNGAEVINLTEAARRHARPDGIAASFAATYSAYGHALLGEDTASRKGFDLAEEKATVAADDGQYAWSRNTPKKQYETKMALGMVVLGSYGQAAREYEKLLSTWPAANRRGWGVQLARKGLAHASAGDVDEAVAVGMQSLVIAAQTGSARNANEIGRLSTALSSWDSSPNVAEFRAVAREVIPAAA